MLVNLKGSEEYEKYISQYTTGAFSTLDMEVFIPEVKKLKKGQTYLEIGVDKGKSLFTATLAAKEGVKVVGVDINDTPERRFCFEKVGLLENAVFIHGYSHKVAALWKRAIKLLFIDGDHTYGCCHLDILSWLPYLRRGSVILFHDCDESSPGVVRAANEVFPNRVQLFKTPTKNTSMAKVEI